MLREAKPDEAGRINAIIASEIAAYEQELGIDSGFKAPGEGAIEASLVAGDAIWIDDSDPRRVAWVHPNDPKSPTSLFVMHAWAPSEKHQDHLEELTDVLILKGWGDIEIKFPRAGTPLTKEADDKFLRPDQKDTEPVGVTTAREAKAQIVSVKVAEEAKKLKVK